MSKELLEQAEWVADGLVKGIAFVPKEKRSWKPAATTRSAQEILAHITYWTLYSTRCLQGEGPWDLSEEAWTSSTKELKDHEQAQKLAEQSSKEFIAATKKLSSQDLAKQVEVPWGRRTLAQFIGDHNWHMTYHAGQLNYIQTLLGDKEDHW